MCEWRRPLIAKAISAVQSQIVALRSTPVPGLCICCSASANFSRLFLLYTNAPQASPTNYFNNIPNPKELKHLGAVALHNAGLYYAEKEPSDRATEVFEYALSLRSDYALALGGVAKAHKQKGQTGQAIEYYQRFLHFRPKMARPHFSLAALQMETQYLQGAVASLERGLVLEPHQAGR